MILLPVLGVNEIYDYGFIGDDSVADNLLSFNSAGNHKMTVKGLYYNNNAYIIIGNYVSCIQFRIDYYTGGLSVRTYNAAGKSFTAWKEL